MTPLPHQDKKDDKNVADALGLSPEILELLAKFQEIELEDFQMDVKRDGVVL